MNSFVEVYDRIRDYCYDKINKNEFNDTSYNLWISPLKPEKLDGNVAYFTVSNEFIKNTFSKNYTEFFKGALKDILGFDVEINITVKAAENEDDNEPNVKKAELMESFSNAEYGYTFGTFIVGRSNEFAYAACTSVAKSPGSTYNPLFIYGPSGLGKTHLMTAISMYIKEERPGTNIIYVTGEAFANELINAIQQKKDTSQFHQKYRSADVLLVDDVQFIAGKESTQEEFFHTFNELHNLGKQIVLTSDRPPKEIKTLEDRIRTRFEWGLIADISSPDFETRVAIIRRKAELLDFIIPPDVSEYIANKLKTNIRQLEGCVKKLKAGQLLMGTPPSMAQAQKAVNEILSEEQAPPITVERVLNEVAGVYSVTAEDICSKKRSSQISMARKVASYVIKEVTDMSFKSIGLELGGRDHSTIMYYYEDIQKIMNKDTHTKEMIEDIVKNIKNNKF
ncbi:MAG: chromosomal replication initiator protein DnaA, partial [Oscillospiraceae bacterium]|nr:chromosomal replication initiator protein DnaA [Oscillospiraceae bacterium]